MDARLILSFLFAFVVCFSNAQPHKCGTKATQADIDALDELQPSSFIRSNMAGDPEPVSAAITAHIVRLSNGTGGLSESQLNAAIENANNMYAASNISFFLLGEINYIDNSAYYNFDSDDEAILTQNNNVENTINIYFFNSVTSSGSPLCGYAYFPNSGIDHIIMDNGCTSNGSTFPHELGHYFGLYHTHGKTNEGTTDELVDGSNCSTAGDDICDTPADPNLTGLINSSCNYTGTATDVNGDPYAPDPNNLMSYSLKGCRDTFSSGQIDRIVSAYQTYKTYLVSKYFAANFDVDQEKICAGSSVHFIDKSVAAATYSWEFPGGNPSTSSIPNPVVVYETQGSYNVKLTITTDQNDSETVNFTDYIEVVNSTSSIGSTAGSFEEIILEEELINDDGGITFEKTNLASSDGSDAITIDMFNYPTEGAEDYIVAEMLDASTEKVFRVSFDYAYARYSEQYSDGMAFAVKDPCGSWMDVWKKEGLDLATAPDHTAAFIPEAGEWVTVELYVQVPNESSAVEFAFKSINGYGNNLYIDNYIMEPAGITLAISDIEVTNATCSNDPTGAIRINTNQSSGITYSIDGENFQSSNDFTGLLPSEYVIYINDAGGPDLLSFAEVGPKPITYNIAQSNTSCPDGNNGFVSIQASGGTGTLQLSFDGEVQSNSFIEGLTVGDYQLVITDSNGCSVSETLSIDTDGVAPETPVINSGDNGLELTVGDGVEEIRWYYNGDLVLSQNDLEEWQSPEIGVYTVEVSNGVCTAVSEPFVILSSNTIRTTLEIYPNPSSDYLNISLPVDLQKRVKSLNIRDLTGRLLHAANYTSTLSIHSLDPGLYFMEVSGDDFVISRRFLKK